LRIAVVDRDRRAQESIRRIVAARGDDVIAFATPSDALAGITGDPKIDVLIASSDGEPLSGVALCRKARRRANAQRPIYLLVMSPPGDRKTKIEALDCGADDVIEKPPAADELLARLRIAERSVALQRSATTDYLSGVRNRGAFFGEAVEACREAGVTGPVAIILLDIDRLKEINDRHGHFVGDAAIRAVAGAAQVEGAIVGRLGGDEFCILLRGYGLVEASDFAADVRLAKLRLETGQGTREVTCSLGIAQFQPGDTVDDLMKRADLTLYRAKEEGGNRIATVPFEFSTSQNAGLRITRARSLPRPSPEVKDRRDGSATSQELLARICAVVDLLIASGQNEEHATHIVAQKMLTAGVAAPRNSEGGNWWQAIHAWRAAARNEVATTDALREYQNVVSAIESIPPLERVKCALENELWNRRRLNLRSVGKGLSGIGALLKSHVPS
jgi:diguanylate cyclase (GGDEF)-like protein